MSSDLREYQNGVDVELDEYEVGYYGYGKSTVFWCDYDRSGTEEVIVAKGETDSSERPELLQKLNALLNVRPARECQ